MIAAAVRVPNVRRREAALRIAAVVFASMSLAALVGHAFGFMRMPIFLELFGVPSIFALLALAALAQRVNAGYFINGLLVGLSGGLLATIVYDVVRYPISHFHLLNYNGFVPISIFGSWITGQAPSSLASAIAGWIYHYWNGLSFGVIYVLIFGNRPWPFGVAYGIVMELCMLGVFPVFLRIANPLHFVIVSLFAHLFYGGVLGVTAQRWASFR